MSEPLRQAQLDRMTCGVPGCTHESHDGLFLHARCHVDTPTWAEYKNGILHITCGECRRPIVDILVAP